MMTKSRTRWTVLAGLAALVVAAGGLWTGCSAGESGSSGATDSTATALLRVETGPTAGAGGGKVDPIPAGVWEKFIAARLALLGSREVLETALSPSLADGVTSGLTPSERMGSEEALRDRVKRIQALKDKLLGAKDPIGRLQELLQVKQMMKPELIVVRFKAADRQFAADVVNSVVESYLVAYTKERKDRERRFLAGLQGQRPALQAKIDEAEKALRTYERENASDAMLKAMVYTRYEALRKEYDQCQEEMKRLDANIAKASKDRDEQSLRDLRFQKDLLQPKLEAAERIMTTFKRDKAIDTSAKPEPGSKYEALCKEYDKLQDEMKLLDAAIMNATISAQVSANSVSVMSWATVPPGK